MQGVYSAMGVRDAGHRVQGMEGAGWEGPR